MASSLIASIKAAGKSLDNMQDLLMLQLKDLYNAEGQLLDALPRMADAATATEVKQAFREHTETTRRQRTRLEQVFSALHEKPQEMSSDGMKGLIQEGELIIQMEGDPDVKDAALIAAAQRVEHYEIAAYGAARTYADYLGQHQASQLLQQTLNEEGDTDHRLTDIAMNWANQRARKTT